AVKARPDIRLIPIRNDDQDRLTQEWKRYLRQALPEWAIAPVGEKSLHGPSGRLQSSHSYKSYQGGSSSASFPNPPRVLDWRWTTLPIQETSVFAIVSKACRKGDRLNRREFLTAGALAAGGWTLADLLRAEAAVGIKSSEKAIINIHLDGGPPQLD